MDEKNKAKVKYRNFDLLIYLVIIVVAFFVGRSIFQNNNDVYGTQEIFTCAIVGIILGYVLSVIFYEVGKLLFGKLSHFQLISINIFGLTFKKENGKLRFSFTKIKNFGGETIMALKNENDKCLPWLYHLGGIILDALAFTGLIFLGIYLTTLLDDGVYRFTSYMMAATCLIVLLLEIVPFYSGALLDGFVLRMILVKDNMKAYKTYLANLYALENDEKLLNKFEDQNVDDFFQAKLLVQNIYYSLLNDDEETIVSNIDRALEHDYLLEDEEIAIVNGYKLFYLLLAKKNEEADALFYNLDANIRKKLNKASFKYFKTAVLLSATLEINYDVYEYLMMKYNRHLKLDYYYALINKEQSLIERALEFIKNEHKEWFGVTDKD